MPDTKFSLPALAEHIRKYLWVYLIGVALCLVGTGLLWTTTAPHPSIEETVVVALADSLTEACVLPDTAEVLSAAEVPDEALLQAVKDAASTAAKMMAEIFLNIMYLPVR